MSKFSSDCCQKCGEPIGWLGRAFELVFGRMHAHKCVLCDSKAVAIFFLSRGCAVLPDNFVQPLCAHHAFKSTPIGCMIMIEDYTKGKEFSKHWCG